MRSNWNTTEAYDLSLYETSPAPIQRPQPAPVEKAAPSKQTLRRIFTRRLLACAVLLVAFLGVMLSHNVTVIELGDEIQTQTETLAALKDENSYLTGKLTARTISEVDQYAAANGLCKVQDYQVSYIRLGSSDQTIRTEKAPTGSFLESVMDRMDTVLEYLRIK